jgi:hypothetical protein
MRFTVIRLLPLCLVGFFLTGCGAGPQLSATADEHQSEQRFPLHPDLDMTPGKLCDHADTHRYPEQIAYCERDVSSGTKQEIIRDYDRSFGYTIEQMQRSEFKIDHFIPLCMGGSNNVANLWPQHKSVYEKTDQLECRLCELMASGEMTQEQAIEKMKYAKFHLDEAPGMYEQLRAHH